MKVRANAETPLDARTARRFGAEGIGLCRTEHMFFDGRAHRRGARDDPRRTTEEGRRAALAKLLPMQRGDFAELFEIMAGLPVTIRLLDPPLHEFLPHTDEEIEEVVEGAWAFRPRSCAPAPTSCTSSTRCSASAAAGWRCAYPEIAEMQARAIFEGAVEAGRKTGKPVTAEIMVPVNMGRGEVDLVKKIVVEIAEQYVT